MPRDRGTWKIAIGSEDDERWCPNCGASDITSSRVSGWPRIRRWLQGGGMGNTTSYSCDACGSGWSTGVFQGREPAGPRWWSLPARLARGIAWARRMHPAPWIYLAALGAGVLLGLGSEMVGGPPWWVLAVALPAAAWFRFALTAFSGREKLGDGWTEILGQVDAERAWKRRERRLHEQLRAGVIPLYGLGPTWIGRRALGGWGGGRGSLTNIVLSHGDAHEEDGQRWIRVTVELRPIPDPSPQHELIRELWRSAEPRPPDLPEGGFMHWHRRRERDLARRPMPEPRTIDLPIDGRPVRGELVAEADEWVAWTRVGDARLSLHARGFDTAEIDLVTITDPGPYIAGSASPG